MHEQQPINHNERITKTDVLKLAAAVVTSGVLLGILEGVFISEREKIRQQCIVEQVITEKGEVGPAYQQNNSGRCEPFVLFDSRGNRRINNPYPNIPHTW
jgi:hypothetical protein